MKSEEREVRVGSDCIFKADNRILSIGLRVNGMMVKNFISKEANVSNPKKNSYRIQGAEAKSEIL